MLPLNASDFLAKDLSETGFTGVKSVRVRGQPSG